MNNPSTAPQLRKKCAKQMRRPPPEAAEMRGFSAVLGAFGGGKGQGGAPPSDFFWFSQPDEGAGPVLKLRAQALAGKQSTRAGG
jgi:hypothetical protein